MSTTSANAPVLNANDLVFSYGYQHLLTNVSLTVASGEKVGLVGRNGCGKSSLLKILAGEVSPDQGTLAKRKGLRIGYVPQEFELNPQQSVRENIESGVADLKAWLEAYESGNLSEKESATVLDQIEAADGWNLQTRIKTIASALDTPDLERTVQHLSGGEKRRVALCRALVAQPDLLLLDEPTNHLDAESIQWLEGFLQSFNGAVIFVTHDRYFLDVIATRIVELADGRAYTHPGNYTAYLEAKAIRQQVAEQSERRRQRFLRVELEWVRAGVRAQRSKAKHRLDTFYQIDGQEAPPEEREMDLLIPPAPEMGNTGVELNAVGVRVGEAPRERWLFENLTLKLEPGRCTGIVGRNGVGKTTLLRLCLGELPPTTGEVVIGKRVRFNYIDQARMQLGGNGTVLQEIADGSESVYFGDQQLSARAYLRRFLFADERVNERVDRLSGGERARLMLAKVLKKGGNLLVLDEPTNDLDLPSLRMLEEALASFGGTALVVSHDRYFLDRICDQIVAFEPEGIFVQPGNYSYYLEKKAARKTAPILSEAAPEAESGLKKTNRTRKRSFKEQREWETIEETILAAEARVSALEKTLDDPSFFVHSAEQAPQLLRELEAARAEVTRLYARWEELGAIPA